MTVDILAIGVHPDDVELSASGTLLKHINAGYSVALCDLTRGELGSRGSAELRLQEAELARKTMGAVARENLGMEDGFFQSDKQNLLSLIRCIRSWQPKIVLANAVTDRHPDHGRAAKLISDACFYAGLIKIETKDKEDMPQLPWRPLAVYHYIQDRNLKPDFLVDISPFMEKKMECIRCFGSQFYSPDQEGPETPISGKAFMEFMYAKNKAYGRDIGADYAEAFTVSRTPGITDLFHLV